MNKNFKNKTNFQFSLLGNNLNNSAVSTGNQKNYISAQTVIDGNMNLKINNDLTFEIDYEAISHGKQELSYNLDNPQNYKLNNDSLDNANPSLDSWKLIKKTGNQSKLSLSFNKDIDELVDCGDTTLCETGVQIPKLTSSSDQNYSLSYNTKIKNFGEVKLAFGEDYVDIQDSSDNKGILGNDTRRGAGINYCYSNNIKCNSGDYNTKLILKGETMTNYPSSNDRNNGIITTNASSAIKGVFGNNNTLYQYGLEFSAKQDCKDYLQLRINRAGGDDKNIVGNQSILYQRKVLTRLCNENSCKDTLGVYITTPDYLMKDSTNSSGASVTKNSKIPLLFGINYCTEICGVTVPIFLERYINIDGTDNADGFFYGIRPKFSYTGKYKANIEKYDCCIEGGIEEYDNNGENAEDGDLD